MSLSEERISMFLHVNYPASHIFLNLPSQLSTHLLSWTELADVLPRRKLAKAIRATGKTPGQLIAEYEGFVNVVTPASIRRTVLDDVDDDAVLACALAANADLIVSGDAHLLNLKRYQGMRIVAAAEALAIVERE